MDQVSAIHKLSAHDVHGRYVYTHADLTKLFHEDRPRARQASLDRLVSKGILTRATRGVYVYALSRHLADYTVERIACALRRGEFSYTSLESALSEYGIISQVLIHHITIMTTGRRGEYRTPFGTIEFTHTKRALSEILDGIQDMARPLPMATPAAAYRDLKRVGRNTQLIQQDDLHEYNLG